ncbi:MAG: hypothetical protein LBE24_07595 [Methylobacillus sp.]|jgi:hypothetical protein|nr:hypothetical protein [Methylobacillus sp.]
MQRTLQQVEHVGDFMVINSEPGLDFQITGIVVKQITHHPAQQPSFQKDMENAGVAFFQCSEHRARRMDAELIGTKIKVIFLVVDDVQNIYRKQCHADPEIIPAAVHQLMVVRSGINDAEIQIRPTKFVTGFQDGHIMIKIDRHIVH